MELFLLILNVTVAILLVIVIMLQKTSTDGLSGIGGGNSLKAIFSSKTTSNFMTKLTGILFFLLIVSCLGLAKLQGRNDILDFDKDTSYSVDEENMGNIPDIPVN